MTKKAGDPANDVGARELRLDRLLGRQVHARTAQRIGRLEEVRAEKHGQTLVITDFVIGASGLLERLGVGVRLLLGHKTSGSLARWDQLDIREPERPRLTCSQEELRSL